MDDILEDFERGINDYWAGIVPAEYRGKTIRELNERDSLSPYLLAWLTVADADNEIGYFDD